MSHAALSIEYALKGFHPIVEQPNSKLPLEKGWQKLVGRTPAELTAAFEGAPEGHGIGTVTEGFIVIDLDVKPGVNGFDSLNALPWLPPTLTSDTPSGGQHRFFRIPAGLAIKNSVSKVGPGVDIRGQGGQVVLPPSSIDGRQYLWREFGCPDVMADLPEPWLTLLAPASQPELPMAPAPAPAVTRVLREPGQEEFEASRRAAYMATLSEPSIQGKGGTAVFMRAVFHAKEMSRTTDEAFAALREWNDRLASPAWSEHAILRAIANSDASFGAGLDDAPVFAPLVPAVAAVPEPVAPARVAPAGPSPAPQAPIAWVESMQAYVARAPDGTWALANPLTTLSAKLRLIASGVPAKRATRLLADGGVPFAAGVTCDPLQGSSFAGPDGVLLLNTYVRPSVTPQPGTFPVLDSVLTFLTCDDPAAKEWLVNWLAFAVQNPARPMRTVPVLFGAQRTGKSVMARVMTTLLGEGNCTAIRNEDIKSRFTSHFVNKLFVTVGEIEASEVGHATSTLKYLTGEPTLKFEAKGANAFDVTNRIKMLCTSNQTLPVNVEGEADTRWVLFKQLTKPEPDYTARMDGLFDQATNGWSPAGQAELAALLAYLLELPVDPVMARTVYANAARRSAVEASRSSVEQFVDALTGSSLDAVWLANVPEYERAHPAYAHMDVPTADGQAGVTALYGTYRAFCRASGLQPLGTGRFPQELERHAPQWTRRKLPSSILATRPWVYEGLPRQPHLRSNYVPWTSRQLPLVEPSSNPTAERATAAMQQAFGLTDDTEEESP